MCELVFNESRQVDSKYVGLFPTSNWVDSHRGCIPSSWIEMTGCWVFSGKEQWNSPGIGEIKFVASDSHHYVGWSVLAKLLHPVLQRLEWFLSERWVRSWRQATLLHHKTLRSLSTDPHVAQNLRGNSSSVEHKRSYLADCPSCSFPLTELECKLVAVKHHRISLYDLCMIYIMSSKATW